MKLSILLLARHLKKEFVHLPSVLLIFSFLTIAAMAQDLVVWQQGYGYGDGGVADFGPSQKAGTTAYTLDREMQTTVTITTPANGASFTPPTNVFVGADATTDGGTIERVEFYGNDQLIGTDASAPYLIVLNDFSSQNYTLVAKAFDQDGVATLSEPVTFTILPMPPPLPVPLPVPPPNLTSPTAGQILNPGDSITFTAVPGPSNYPTTRVEFYLDTTLVGSDNTAPYSFTLNGVGAGAYSVSARTVANTGARATSQPVDIRVLGSTSTPTATSTQTPTPTPATVISGTVTYGNAIGGPSKRFIANVLVSAVGSTSMATVTDFPTGSYALSGFGPGSYTVTPSKTGGANSISSFDAARIAQHVAGVNSLAGSQLVVADVSGNGAVSSFDAAEVASYVVSTTPFGTTGTWKFDPVNRTYPSITTNITGQDYTAMLMGEVSGNWTNGGSRPAGGGSSNSERQEEDVLVSSPHLVTPTGQDVVIPVSVEGVAEKGIIAYEFELRYDSLVIRPQANPVYLAKTVSRKLSVAVNADEAGLLKVAVYGPVSINTDGILLTLRFTAIGGPGSVSPLTWESLMFNEGSVETVMMDGEVRLTAGRSTASERRVNSGSIWNIR